MAAAVSDYCVFGHLRRTQRTGGSSRLTVAERSGLKNNVADRAAVQLAVTNAVLAAINRPESVGRIGGEVPANQSSWDDRPDYLSLTPASCRTHSTTHCSAIQRAELTPRQPLLSIPSTNCLPNFMDVALTE